MRGKPSDEAARGQLRSQGSALPLKEVDCSNWDADAGQQWSTGSLVAVSRALPPTEVECTHWEDRTAGETSAQKNGSVCASLRVIKLSDEDPDMATEEEVNRFFTETLATRQPSGRFRYGDRKDRIADGDQLIFSYKGKLAYLARVLEGRRKNADQDSRKYPYLFRIDVNTIERVSGDLSGLERLLHDAGLYDKSIVQGPGWPHIRVPSGKEGAVEKVLEKLRE